MSLDAAVSFLNYLSEDEERVSSIQTLSKDEVLAMAQTQGHEMTMDEFRLVLIKGKQLNNDELTDKELEQITAGIAAVAIYGLGCLAIVCGIKLYIKGDEKGWW